MRIAEQLAAAAAVEVDFRTAHTPPIQWTPDDGGTSSSSSSSPASSGGGGLRRAFLRWLRPELTVHTAFGTVHRAPYGAAGASSWPLVPLVAGVVVLVVLGLAVYGLAALVRR